MDKPVIVSVLLAEVLQLCAEPYLARLLQEGV